MGSIRRIVGCVKNGSALWTLVPGHMPGSDRVLYAVDPPCVMEQVKRAYVECEDRLVARVQSWTEEDERHCYSTSGFTTILGAEEVAAVPPPAWPVFGRCAVLIFFIVAISWWWWNEAVASSAIHDGVRTAGARYGDLTQGRQVAYERLHIALGRLNADQYQAGLTVWSDPTHRAVQGQAQAERTLDVPFLSSATFWVQAGSFQRKWQFYGGSPNGWE